MRIFSHKNSEWADRYTYECHHSMYSLSTFKAWNERTTSCKEWVFTSVTIFLSNNNFTIFWWIEVIFGSKCRATIPLSNFKKKLMRSFQFYALLVNFIWPAGQKLWIFFRGVTIIVFFDEVAWNRSRAVLTRQPRGMKTLGQLLR